jgi:hypothetical protein
MDKLSSYREIVKATLNPLLSRHYSGLDARNETVFDEANDRYLVVTVGWEPDIRRIYRPLVQLDIINGKIWIQHDNTEEGIAYDLEEAGIPKSDIVLAFHPEHVRPHTGYAVA